LLRTRADVSALAQDPEYLELQGKLRATSGDFIGANNAIETLKLDLQRVEADAAVVTKRIARDEQALRTTSVVRDAQGLQQELRTLERRRGELEEQELGIMQAMDDAEAALAAVSESRAATETALKAVIAKLEKEQARLVSGAELAKADRKQLAERIPSDLVSIYEQLRAKGTPVGRLINAECGACRMAISATNLAEILRTASDALVYCPDCGAILVR